MPTEAEDDSRREAHVVLSLRSPRAGVRIPEIGQHVFGLEQTQSDEVG